MQRLLNELLELSRVGRLANPPERVPFEDIVREAALLVEGRLRAHDVRLTIASDLPDVFVDRVRLVEVVQNLLDNGVKFMGSQIEPHLEVGVRDEENRRVFFVRDNGVGIDPHYHDRVFGLFDKLDPKSEGTGVGLALVKCTAGAFGWNRPDWDKGQRFASRCPCLPKARAAARHA